MINKGFNLMYSSLIYIYFDVTSKTTNYTGSQGYHISPKRHSQIIILITIFMCATDAQFLVRERINVIKVEVKRQVCKLSIFTIAVFKLTCLFSIIIPYSPL